MMAKQRGYTARADLFREALRIYDRQQEEAKSEYKFQI
jgi:metal-responsive CopG/Arc/MetJ family transcriptional regulator